MSLTYIFGYLWILKGHLFYIVLGRHCCCFCLLSKADMQTRTEPGILRTLDLLNEHFATFEASGGKKENAKNFYNVVATPILNIPVDHVSKYCNEETITCNYIILVCGLCRIASLLRGNARYSMEGVNLDTR